MKAARIISVLTIIGLISGGLLAWVNGIADPLIRENRKRAVMAAVIEVLPGVKTVNINRRKGTVVFRGFDGKHRLVGNAFKAVGSGFQGKIDMMVGLDPRFAKVLGIKILDNVETPGLGKRIGEKSFQAQFKGMSATEDIILLKNRAADKAANQVEAISGATISSRAVVKGLNEDIAAIRKVWLVKTK